MLLDFLETNLKLRYIPSVIFYKIIRICINFREKLLNNYTFNCIHFLYQSNKKWLLMNNHFLWIFTNHNFSATHLCNHMVFLLYFLLLLRIPSRDWISAYSVCKKFFTEILLNIYI